MSVLTRMTVHQGDITRLEVDAIVNAANQSLMGGGGVDGAIHRAAGPGLLEECRTLGGCPTGDARSTRGYHLPARHVIHAVGPRWQGGHKGEPAALAACYRRALELVSEAGCRTVAFPAISQGIYGYPPDQATEIAVRTVYTLLEDLPDLEVTFCCFDADSAGRHRATIAGL